MTGHATGDKGSLRQSGSVRPRSSRKVEHNRKAHTLPLEILAASLRTRLTLDELEWLWRELAQHTEAERRGEVQIEQRESLSSPRRTGALGRL
jgi:hypothetical protein